MILLLDIFLYRDTCFGGRAGLRKIINVIKTDGKEILLFFSFCVYTAGLEKFGEETRSRRDESWSFLWLSW